MLGLNWPISRSVVAFGGSALEWGLTNRGLNPGRKKIRPPPLLPFFGAEGIFKGRGGGGCISEAHLRQDFYSPPHLFHTPPSPGRVFSGVGGVHKIWQTGA